MPDLGLGKAIGRAVREGASKAKVMRPGEAEALAADAAARGAKAADTLAPIVPTVEPVLAPVTPTARRVEPVVDPVTPTAMPKAPPTPAPSAVVPGGPSAIPVPAPPVAEPVAFQPRKVKPVTLTGTALDEQAQRIADAKLSDYDVTQQYQPNFDVIKTTDDIKATMAELAQGNRSAVEEAIGPVKSHENTLALARMLDLPTDVIEPIMTRKFGSTGLPTTQLVAAARQFLNSSAGDLKELGTKIATGTATDVDRVRFARQAQLHNEFYAEFRGVGADVARALNAMGIPVEGFNGADAGRISEILANNGGNIDKMAAAIRMADSAEGVTKIVQTGLFKQIKSVGIGFVNRTFVNGILSGVKTSLRNIAGNVLMPLAESAEMAVAARMGRFLGSEEGVQTGEALATLHATIGATSDAFRLARRTLKTGTTIDNILQVDTATGALLTDLPGVADRPWLQRMLGVADTVIDAPTKRLIASQDEFFKTMAYRADLERQAYLHVKDQVNSGAITIDQASAAARDFMERPSEEAQKEALKWAAHVTFQTPLGPGGAALQKFLRTYPVLTLIAPFVRTPTNIFKEFGKRTPLAAFSESFWRDVQAGGRARDLALTRFAMGSATATMVAYWAMNEDITGAGPQDPAARLALGPDWQPYSFRIPNGSGGYTYQSYAALEPIASMLGATADAVEIGAYLNADVDTLKSDDAQWNQAAGAIIAGVMNNTGNKTFMKGISDVTELLNNPGQEIQGYMNSMVVSLTPYSALSRDIRNISDPYLREAWTVNAKLRDNTPGLSSKLPPRLGLFAEERRKASGSLLGVLSPFPDQADHQDEVYQELAGLMRATHAIPLTMPTKSIEGLRLTEQEYTDLVTYSRGEPIKEWGGKTLHQKIESDMATAEYLRQQPLAQVEAIKKLQHVADDHGRDLLAKRNPDYAMRLQEWTAEKHRLTGK